MLNFSIELDFDRNYKKISFFRMMKNKRKPIYMEGKERKCGRSILEKPKDAKRRGSTVLGEDV